MSSNEPGSSKHSVDLLELRSLQLKSSGEILSVADKYNYMSQSYRRILAFGKLSYTSTLVLISNGC